MPIINFIILNQVQNYIYLFIISTSIWYFRAIITAAHCVCSERTENKERYLKCIPNSDKKNPSNQIISGRDIFYVVGQRIVDREIDNRLNSNDISVVSEALDDLPKAKKAFVYENYKENSKHIDIGLILTREDTNARCFLKLPEKG